MYVLQLLASTITVPTFDSCLDAYQAYFWYQQGEINIALTCLAFTYAPALLGFVLAFASFKEEVPRINCFVYTLIARMLIFEFKPILIPV